MAAALVPLGAMFAQPNPYVYQHAVAANVSGAAAAVAGGVCPAWPASAGAGGHVPLSAPAAVHSVPGEPLPLSHPL